MKRCLTLFLLLLSLGSYASNDYNSGGSYRAPMARISVPYYPAYRYRDIPPPPHRHYHHGHDDNIVVRKPRGHRHSVPVAPRAHGHDNLANNPHGQRDGKYYPPQRHRPNENSSAGAHGHD